ncbi:MAG: hypothetical protein ACLUR9_10200 [Christensenellales bacterium]
MFIAKAKLPPWINKRTGEPLRKTEYLSKPGQAKTSKRMITYCQQSDCKNETAYHRAELPELLAFADSTYLIQKYVELLSVTLFFVAQAIVFGLVYRYLKSEPAFTEKTPGGLKNWAFSLFAFLPLPSFRKPSPSGKGRKALR